MPGPRRRSPLWALPILWTCAAPAAAQGTAGFPRARFPLEVAVDGERLVDQDGRPFRILGDAAWSLMVALTKAETSAYLADRQVRGFDAVLVNLIERAFGGPANRDGELPFLSGADFARPNEAYFAHVDWVLDEAASHGLLVLLAPAYLGIVCGEQGWCQQMLARPVADLTAYGDFLGARYAARTNVLWVHGGDAHDESVDARVNAIANAIRARAPAHLHTAHCSRGRSALDCYDQPWLDVNSTYSDCDTTAAEVANDHQRAPMPSFHIEGRYENEADASERCLLTQIYASLLGGSQGHVFGNHPIWRFARGWEEALDGFGSRAMEHAARLFASREGARLVPDDEARVVTGGRGRLDGAGYTPAARSDDGRLLIAYAPTARTLTVDLSKLSGTAVRAWSFDPRDGSARLLGRLATSGSEPIAMDGPEVLVLDDAALELPAPGTLPVPEPNATLLAMAAAATLAGLGRQRRGRARRMRPAAHARGARRTAP